MICANTPSNQAQGATLPRLPPRQSGRREGARAKGDGGPSKKCLQNEKALKTIGVSFRYKTHKTIPYGLWGMDQGYGNNRPGMDYTQNVKKMY